MSTKKKPNVLLITTDQQRKDTLGVFGSKIAKTPNIDALAKDGTAFNKAFAQNPVCVPSRACIQTGRYTHQHGVTYMESVVDDTPGLPEHEKTFWQYLKEEEQYYTAAFGKIHMYPEKGFDEMKLSGGKGERWTQSKGLPIGPGPLGPDYEAWLEEKHPGGYEKIYEQRRLPEYKEYKTALENVLPLDEYIDYWIAENTIKCIEKQDGDKPFFIWCGFCGPHGPTDPPKPYSTMYSIDDMPLPLEYYNTPVEERRSEYVVKRFIAYYCGLVTLLDDLVGDVVESLKKKGIYDNTIIVYTSDHGEMMGDFGLYGKGNFYDTTINMPLIIKPVKDEQGVSHIDGLVEHIDIAPTILDYAGVKIPGNIEGISLRDAIKNGFEGKESILSEHTTNDKQRHGISLRDEKYKFWYWTNPDTIALFDLENDPDELNNLAGDPAFKEIADKMMMQTMAKVLSSKKQ